MSKNLIVDCIPFEYDRQMLTESADLAGPLVITGVLQRAEAKNQNGRVYPKTILERESEKYLQNNVNQRRALGELDHPDSSVVNLRNVSHNVTDMWWDGNDLVGKVEVLSTPAGNILKELFRSGVNVGVSSRGLGSVRETRDGGVQVEEDFELIAFDMVSNPSTHGAFLAPLTESVDRERVKEANKWFGVEAIVQDIIQEMTYDFSD